MSWSRLIAGVMAAALAAGLSGCFQPMYGEAAHPGLVAEVRAIDVQPIDTRIGHYFIEDLRSALNGTGQPLTPKYRLVSTISTGQQTPTVDTQTQTASSATLIGDTTFTLVRLSDNKTLYTGTASAAAAYDRTAQRYASLRAARDAEIRLARDLADEISTRIAARLSDKP
jgi:LPS-assembly lipoprotein